MPSDARTHARFRRWMVARRSLLPTWAWQTLVVRLAVRSIEMTACCVETHTHVCVCVCMCVYVSSGAHGQCSSLWTEQSMRFAQLAHLRAPGRGRCPPGGVHDLRPVGDSVTTGSPSSPQTVVSQPPTSSPPRSVCVTVPLPPPVVASRAALPTESGAVFFFFHLDAMSVPSRPPVAPCQGKARRRRYPAPSLVVRAQLGPTWHDKCTQSLFTGNSHHKERECFKTGECAPGALSRRDCSVAREATHTDRTQRDAAEVKHF